MKYDNRVHYLAGVGIAEVFTSCGARMSSMNSGKGHHWENISHDCHNKPSPSKPFTTITIDPSKVTCRFCNIALRKKEKEA